MKNGVRLLVGALLSVGPYGCSNSEAGECGFSQHRQAIVGGSAASGFVELGASQARAIVALRMVRGGEFDSCSGVMLAPNWVVTARHCIEGVESGSISVMLWMEEAAVFDYVQLEEVIVNDSVDLSLLRVSLREKQRRQVTPMRMAHVLPQLREGSPVELAGFGADEEEHLGRLRFAVETVVRIDDEAVVVSGSPLSGACVGDSGGPLLTRGEGGSVVVVGVLRSGAGDCVGEDTFQRLDSQADWLTPLLGDHGEDSAAEAGCGQIDQAGRCYADTAVWCSKSQLIATRCGQGSVCGWNWQAAGYRCVSEDPCFGIRDIGVCDGTRAIHCREGVLVAADCEQCRGVCARSPQDGRVGCLIE